MIQRIVAGRRNRDAEECGGADAVVEFTYSGNMKYVKWKMNEMSNYRCEKDDSKSNKVEEQSFSDIPD